jgi:electron transport complex protein RnfG
MGEFLRLTGVLTVICLMSGLAIGLTQERTRERIAAQDRQARQQALSAVLPEGTVAAEEQGEPPLPSPYWTARKGSIVVAYAFEASSVGYAGPIRFMAGVDTLGAVTGLSVLEQSETPGLGSRVLEVASKRYLWNPFAGRGEEKRPWFLSQFRGIVLTRPVGIEKTAGEWHRLDQPTRTSLAENNSITAITGATISTRAVVEGLERTVGSYLQKLRERT